MQRKDVQTLRTLQSKVDAHQQRGQQTVPVTNGQHAAMQRGIDELRARGIPLDAQTLVVMQRLGLK